MLGVRKRRAQWVIQNGARLVEVDAMLGRQLEQLTTLLAATDPAPLPAPRSRRKPYRNQPAFDIRDPLHRMTGVDITQIDGIAPYTALRLISEIGTDMSKWPTEHHFTSWLTLAPCNKVSGGKLLSSRTQPSANRAAAVLRLAAMSLGRTQTALGAFFRRLAFRIGKAKAITATARKLAILVYKTLKREIQYKDPGPTAYDVRYRVTVVRRINQRANALGFALVNRETGEILREGVS